LKNADIRDLHTVPSMAFDAIVFAFLLPMILLRELKYVFFSIIRILYIQWLVTYIWYKDIAWYEEYLVGKTKDGKYVYRVRFTLRFFLYRAFDSLLGDELTFKLFCLKARWSSIFYKPLRSYGLYKFFYRIVNSKAGFNSTFKDFPSREDFLKGLKTTSLIGLKSIWNGLKFWLVALIIALSLCYYSMVIRCVPFNKIVFVWIVVAMFAYWLLSGFVFFIKKYQFGKFTSAIQRFWRRSYILFWLIEFSLFSVFFYLTLNANNESWYMYDQLQVFKTGLFSWRSFLMKIFPLTLLLLCGYLFLLTMKWNIFNKHSLWLLLLTVLLLYIVWVEFYQFFHVINFYGSFNWVFDIDEKVWSLELEVRKSRTVNHYIMLMIMLKFWHIVFIFIIWVFFVLRSLEIGRIRYPLLSANLQNFLILYLFAWVMMFPWLKFIFRRYLDMPYYWFYVNNRKLGYRIFFNDISLYYYGISNFVYYYFVSLKNFFTLNFFYWSYESDYFAFKKSFIKNTILSSLQK